LLYCDIIHTVEKLDDQTAGQLFKHYLRYINDQNPVAENPIVDILFEQIKQQLKRDLRKWDLIKEKRSDAGKISAEKRKQQTSTKSTHVESVQQTSTKSTVNVNDNVTVNVNVKDKVKDILLKKESKSINKNIGSRKIDFEIEVLEFQNVYDRKMLEDFFRYWSEPSMDKLKMRWEIGKTWNTSLRLITWSKNQSKFNTPQNGNKHTGTTKIATDFSKPL